jgi:flagellar basal-body rod modification protein FlgD
MTDMTTTPATAGRTAAASAGAAAAEEPDRPTAEADFETFLALLTTQMRNQDPLKPMESTEFVAQLASFSSVEQQIRSNERLESILGALSDGPGAGLAEWIGLDAETTATVRYDGGALELKASPPTGADRAVLQILDAEGRSVGSAPIDPKAESVAWDGEAAGRDVPPGSYRFEAAYFAGESALGSEPLRRELRISDLRFADDGPRLGLAGGGEIAPDQVLALRKPDA